MKQVCKLDASINMLVFDASRGKKIVHVFLFHKNLQQCTVKK